MKRIFLTVGTNTPFDRLLKAMDQWCSSERDFYVFGQIGPTDYLPRNYDYKRFLEPNDFNKELESCDIIVSHAGMGTIISAIQDNKPIIVMPRKASLNETRNDHQLSTCRYFSDMSSIHIAWDENDLPEEIRRISGELLQKPSQIRISEKLKEAIQNLVDSSGDGDCKVMCIASGGGHWIQLGRIIAELKSCKLIQVTTELGKALPTFPPSQFFKIPHATRWNKIGLIKTAISVLALILKTKPDVIISTGAAPGFFAIFWGKLLNAKTVWVDSIANAGELSLSGKKVNRFAHLWLTQWPHLAKPHGPKYLGSVMER